MNAAYWLRRILAAGLAVVLVLPLLPALLRAEAPAPGGDVQAVFDGLAARHGATPARVRLLCHNREAWYARWWVVEHARKTIDTTYFIVEDDFFGRAFLGALLWRARQGVHVRFMIDARGNGPLAHRRLASGLLAELAREPNVEVRVYNPLLRALPAMLSDLRSPLASNHDKLLIADGEWVVTGGRNISHNYLAPEADHQKAYRDVDVLIQGGDVPAQAHAAFEREFVSAPARPPAAGLFARTSGWTAELDVARRVMQARLTGLEVRAPAGGKLEPLVERESEEAAAYPGLAGYAAWEPLSGEHPVPVLLLDKVSRRVAGDDEVTPALAALFEASREEVVVQNPYVVLSGEGRKLLVRAGQRGVRVVLHTNSPRTTNHRITQALFAREWAGLMRDVPGLEIHGYQGDRLLHAKVFVFDRKIAVVGTYNLDPLSRDINSEQVAVVRAPEFATRCRLEVLGDVGRSVQYRIEARPGGGVSELTGPADTVSPEVMRELDMLGPVAQLLRPLL